MRIMLRVPMANPLSQTNLSRAVSGNRSRDQRNESATRKLVRWYANGTASSARRRVGTPGSSFRPSNLSQIPPPHSGLPSWLGSQQTGMGGNTLIKRDPMTVRYPPISPITPPLLQAGGSGGPIGSGG